MKHPIRLSDSTPYYEKHFLLTEETPHAYVSAFREAQYEALEKRRQGRLVFWAMVLLSFLAWLANMVPLLLSIVVIASVWMLVSWRNRHETRLLARTFEIALEGKGPEFHEQMWRHLDRRLLGLGP
jgi:hypothetical protein